MGSECKNYKSELNLLAEENYDNKKMMTLLKKDLLVLGEKDYIELLSDTDSYNYFNKFYFYCENTNAFYMVVKVLSRKTITSFRVLDDDYFYYKIGKKGFINIWKGSEKMNKYKKMNFVPLLECPSDTYNTFGGFAYESGNKIYNMSEIVEILDFIKYVLVSEKNYNYFMRWVSHIRQKPYEKTGVGIILYSDMQGVGKNLMINIFGKIFSGYNGMLDRNLMNSRFNKLLESKLFVYGDEMNITNKRVMGKLTKLITQETIEIKPKGKKSYEMRDNINYIFTTNDCMVMEIKNPFYKPINCAETRKSSKYYENIANIINNETKMRELDKYLASLDLPII
jgi:hypothetical protein